jgi:DNA-binding NarL/FixJ family response regulator
MPQTKTRIMLADDHPDVLRQITALLSPEFDIVGVVANGAALVAEGCRLKPDVVITDLMMPGLNGIEAGRNLLKNSACKAVVVLSMHDDPGLAKAAFEAGIQGYVLKLAAGDDLIPAIRQIIAGGTFVSRQLSLGSQE